MTMTHYMELIASHQPWNLIVYMAIPVILAETIAISELYLLFTRKNSTWVKTVSTWSGILAGFYFLGITIYLLTTVVVPLTTNHAWRGMFDIIAVSCYLLGVIPLMGIALLDSGFFSKTLDTHTTQKWHAICVAVFLVVAHIAMIFGMLNPDLITKQPSLQEHMMSM